MRLIICLGLCLMQIFSSASADSEGKYTVIAPGTIHSGDKYTAAVAVHHTAQPCKIKVGITGLLYNETKVVEVSSNEVKHVEFDVPEIDGNDDYNVTAEGINCMNNFKNSTRLNVDKFHKHVHIQTDKGLYKPGDEINYRVIFLDKNLKPVQPRKDDFIWIEDGKRNRIKEIRDFKVTKGVHTGKFKISEFPVLGNWRMGVNNPNHVYRTVYFEVNKYVLPKFVVKVEATESVSVKDGDMQVIVRANYTYGKPLDGKATVILSLGGSYYFNPIIDSDIEKAPTLIKTADMIKGKAKIDFNVKEYEPYLLDKKSAAYMHVEATVEEQFTGVKINGTSSSTLFPYRYTMQCVSYETCSSFVADKEMKLLFQLTYIDGSMLGDTKSDVELIYKEVLSTSLWLHRRRELDDDDTVVITTPPPQVSGNRVLKFKGHMNETGFVNFMVSLPDLPEYEGYNHFYSMELKYLDEQRELYNVLQYREPKKEDQPQKKEPKEYLHLLSPTDHGLPFNKAAEFTLNSSQPMPYIDYNIIGRGNILQSGHIDLPDKPKVYNITLTNDINWVPTFSIYAYYVDDKGEYHYAERRYFIDFELQNQINVTAPEQVKPGQEVALKIKTEPNSFVGLMAVDKSVLRLADNNDFKPHDFTWILSRYSTHTRNQGGYTYYPGTNSGCVTLTNADYYYNYTAPYYNPRPYIFNPAAVERDSINSVGGYAVKFDASSASALRPHSGAGAGGGGVGGVSADSVQVRKDFSETWLFADIENTETEEFTWSKKIPETITSWVLTAFSLHPVKGLGITKDSTKITTFLPFFISIRLPYSVKRGEVINIPALVFNYLDKALDVEVTLDNSDDEYEFTEFSNEVIAEAKRTKSVRVPANGAAGVSFLVRPKVLGNVMLKFTAISPVAGDAIHKPVKVVPEGLTQYANRAYFVNLKEKPEEKNTFELELPEDLVPDSEHVEVGVMGDILGPVLNNLDNLVRLPSGCGEQTMSALMPNYLVMKYLQNSKRLTPTLERKLRYNMETGYQNMLRYLHNDNSFSSFGQSVIKDKPRNGSTWLTAYIVRSFQSMKEFVNIDDKIIDNALEYLKQQQAANGSFTEKGDYFYAAQRNDIVLTSAAVLAFLENDISAQKYSSELKRAVDYIASNIDKTDAVNAKAIGTYTLNKAKHNAAKEQLGKFKALAKTESDRMWWTEDKKKSRGDKWWRYVFSNDVETTAYGLLSLLDQESTKIDDILPIIKWLVAQRNSYGGFASSQDTVVGLTALIKFAQFADYEPAKMTVNIESKNKKETIKLTEDNGILYQNVELPSKTKVIDFTAQGTGAALVQIAYQYNIFEKDPKPSFTIKTTRLDKSENPSHLDMLVCVNYVGEGEASNMALLEISTPSGYVIDDEIIKDLNTLKGVSNVELKNSDSLLVIYFDHLHKDNESCLMVEAIRTHAVAMQKPASIKLYDYYDTDKKATAFYEVQSKLCDICENEEECSKCK